MIFSRTEEEHLFSRTEEEHLRHVQLVLQKLANADPYMKASKCKFAKTSTTFLGFSITHAGISVDPKKIEAILNWSPPTTITEVRAFLGFTGFYRRFVRNYATIAAPLTALTSSTVPFPSTLPPSALDAFRTLQTALTTTPVLALPHTGPNSEFELYTASIVGLGAVLLQDGHHIAFESRKLNPAERNYFVHELELLAIVHAVRTFRRFLEGCKHFTLFTDHHSLQHFFTQPNLSRRQARWALDLADFQPNMTITYKPGSHKQVDALSRLVGQTLASVNLLFTQFTLSNNSLTAEINNNNNNRRLVTLAEHTSDHGRQTN